MNVKLLRVFNIYDQIRQNPNFYKQFRCGESLLTIFECLLKNKHEDVWSQHNYVAYVVEGRKIWHTAYGTFPLQKGDCVFVKKGASIVEQFFDSNACFIFFFIPDEFIIDTLKDKFLPKSGTLQQTEPIISIGNNPIVESFFLSMISYFNSDQAPSMPLLELKFKELVLTLADNKTAYGLINYFTQLIQQPRAVNLQQVMEENFCFNLSLEAFARLSARSLSAFKRDFTKVYQTSPGKWLLEKRLHHAKNLLTNTGKSVNEAAFESGFENVSHFSRSFRQRFGTSPASIKLQLTSAGF